MKVLMKDNQTSQHRLSLNRRSVLKQSGAIGLATVGSTLYAEAKKEPVPVEPPKAKGIINIFLSGGLAAQESWDPKIYAPAEYRGPLSSIQTKLPGVHLSQYLSETAKIIDKITICRSMTHGEAAHERGTHNMMTAYRPSPAIQFPSVGSIISHELGARNELPPYVCIPNMANEFQGTGYMSSSFGPFSVGDDPNKKDFKVRDLEAPKDLTPAEDLQRRQLLNIVNQEFQKHSKDDGVIAMETFYKKAYELMGSAQAREAFDINKETNEMRDRYGRTPMGQGFLLARRLVESGSRYVSLNYGSWDHHENIKGGIQKNLPHFDKAFASLIQDLDSRGLLSETIVLVTSEFGRTPKINKDGGRDHYPKVYSVAMAGGAYKRGFVYGKSNATSTEVEEDPLTVQDFAATFYSQLGIDYRKRIIAPGNRPIDIVRQGKVCEDLLA